MATSLRAPSSATLTLLSSALRDLRLTQPALWSPLQQHRHASHQAQGRANGARDGPGKRLGAKKTGGEYVVPGNILFKQRGTHWFPGDNCYMGRDHTIHAGSPGYVRYYRDPLRHPKRRFIGIVFEPTQSLPQPPHAARRRQLGMLAYQAPTPPSEPVDALSTLSSSPDIPTPPQQTRQTITIKSRSRTGAKQSMTLTLRPGGQYRQSNYEIGRAAERKEAEALERGKSARSTRMYPEFKKGDRWAAWRKSSVRIARNNERRAMGRKGGKKGKN